jgi:hypothetical protein
LARLGEAWQRHADEWIAWARTGFDSYEGDGDTGQAS